MALGDAILACLTERPMTGYELAKTFDSSIGFFWKANHQQIYRELSRLRDRGHVQGREVVQSGKPNKLVYTLTPEGRAALKHWAARPSVPPSIKDDLLVRLCALDSIDIEPLRADLMAGNHAVDQGREASPCAAPDAAVGFSSTVLESLITLSVILSDPAATPPIAQAADEGRMAIGHGHAARSNSAVDCVDASGTFIAAGVTDTLCKGGFPSRPGP